MTNLARRLRKLEAQRPTGEDLVIQIEYVNEQPKCSEAGERLRPSVHGTGVTTMYLREGDLNL
jgi:hypothetical protein